MRSSKRKKKPKIYKIVGIQKSKYDPVTLFFHTYQLKITRKIAIHNDKKNVCTHVDPNSGFKNNTHKKILPSNYSGKSSLTLSRLKKKDELNVIYTYISIKSKIN